MDFIKQPMEIENRSMEIIAPYLAEYKLSEAEIKQLVVKDKWLATLQSRIENRLENAIQQLISRLNTLEDRYRSPMTELAQEVEIWQSKVDAHLKNMGFGG